MIAAAVALAVAIVLAVASAVLYRRAGIRADIEGFI